MHIWISVPNRAGVCRFLSEVDEVDRSGCLWLLASSRLSSGGAIIAANRNNRSSSANDFPSIWRSFPYACGLLCFDCFIPRLILTFFRYGLRPVSLKLGHGHCFRRTWKPVQLKTHASTSKYSPLWTSPITPMRQPCIILLLKGMTHSLRSPKTAQFLYLRLGVRCSLRGKNLAELRATTTVTRPIPPRVRHSSRFGCPRSMRPTRHWTTLLTIVRRRFNPEVWFSALILLRFSMEQCVYI